MKKDRVAAFGWYLLFGFLHEISHLVAAWILGIWRADGNVWIILLQAMLGRACLIKSDDEASLGLVRHVGWMTSLTLAWIVQRYQANSSSSCRTVAWITCIEALCTDLLGFKTPAAKGMMFCGNFGIVFMNADWVKEEGGRNALNLLEAMINITMIRGAQSGGVLAWDCSGGKAIGVRSRVVNGKRTDLSKLMINQLKRKIAPLGRLPRGIQCFYGHTRFATSAKTTLDGTHPHHWTPPQRRRVISVTSLSEPTTVMMVQNMITHNGDFEIYVVNDVPYDLETVQHWLVKATGVPMPSAVDSAAIAGMIDILRTAGSFGLSIRYALLLKSKSSEMNKNVTFLPAYKEYEDVGMYFEKELIELCIRNDADVLDVKRSKLLRRELIGRCVNRVREEFMGKTHNTLTSMIALDEEEGDKASLQELVDGAVNAFFDNDLIRATQIFMQNAKGSFGLMVTSSLDAHRQVCIAARGQPMSVAFYPKKGILCYASESAAVKAGMAFEVKRQGVDLMNISTHGNEGSFVTKETSRLDLDDLGGEIVLLDWGRASGDALVRDPSFFGRSRTQFMQQGEVDIRIYQESKTATSQINKRLLSLEGNELVQPLPVDSMDPVGDDIRQIPAACKAIQDSWAEKGLNRYTAWNLVRSIKHHLSARIRGKIPSHSGVIDILLTGCEVSLWLSEQFATDLQKAFPKLSIRAVSSNKLLGVFGQELSMPAVGYPISETFPDLNGAIVIIVSHSGQTFAPLACSSLLQSFTRDIFVVTSEWDTQIGKQLRAMYKDDDDMFSSRIFVTSIGVRPAEPCSLTVAATQQLLTHIFMHIGIALLSDHEIRKVCGAVITETDLQILARCNQDSIHTLEKLVGTTMDGKAIDGGSSTEKELRSFGDVWSEHVLENVKAYLITFVYIVGTVTSGYPLLTGVAIACGLESGWAFYITRFFDSLLYFFFHQLTVFALRLIQGRELRHRTVGRTVVIGDIPWVSQAADAFLSKLFACAYPLADLNVFSGNPSDHLVHKHTHRIVRGTLLVCGRPDGRLAALNSADTSVCLSVKQASSISGLLGGTCESVTIGHNASKLSLMTSRNIVLPTSRPEFLCERVVGDMDREADRKLLTPQSFQPRSSRGLQSMGSLRSLMNSFASESSLEHKGEADDVPRSPEQSLRSFRQSSERRSTQSLKSMYLALTKQSSQMTEMDDTNNGVNQSLQKVLREMLKEQQDRDIFRRLFNEMDKDNTGKILVSDFVDFYLGAQNGDLSKEQMHQVLSEAAVEADGSLNFDEFVHISNMQGVEILRKLQVAPRDDKGFLQVEPSQEAYFGENLQDSAVSTVGVFAMNQSQNFAMELWESRTASLERFVAMCVLFHQMGNRVQDFFFTYSLGILGYRMDHTHSIMRVATTASPVSGSDVRERIEALALRSKIQNSIRVIATAWRRYKERKILKEKSDIPQEVGIRLKLVNWYKGTGAAESS